jgi:MoxR-like ATPase
VVDAPKDVTLVDGPGDRDDADPEHALHFAHEIERLAPRAVHLVDECEDWHLPLLADAEELLRLRLDPLGAVEEHDRRVGGVERAVGVLAEVGVARSVEQVHLQAVVAELEDARRDRDPALALELHPVAHRRGAPPLRLDRAGELNGTSIKEELLGERRLTRVRVRDDRKRLAAADLLDEARVVGVVRPELGSFCRGSMWSCALGHGPLGRRGGIDGFGHGGGSH